MTFGVDISPPKDGPRTQKHTNIDLAMSPKASFGKELNLTATHSTSPPQVILPVAALRLLVISSVYMDAERMARIQKRFNGQSRSVIG